MAHAFDRCLPWVHHTCKGLPVRRISHQARTFPISLHAHFTLSFVDCKRYLMQCGWRPSYLAETPTSSIRCIRPHIPRTSIESNASLRPKCQSALSLRGHQYIPIRTRIIGGDILCHERQRSGYCGHWNLVPFHGEAKKERGAESPLGANW